MEVNQLNLFSGEACCKMYKILCKVYATSTKQLILSKAFFIIIITVFDKAFPNSLKNKFLYKYAKMLVQNNSFFSANPREPWAH